MSYDLGVEIDLVNKSIIDRAHRRNIAVQYWTINDADDMRTLIELGCDCIMTDNPALLREVLAEYAEK
jgi:glycerophosphoryl diester phosphodiesterase